MGMSNCPRCGKFFNQVRVPICPACEKEEEADFQKVKEYISENPGSTMAEISTETKVLVKRIQKFLRDGRLEVTKGLAGSINCTSCGMPISTGKLCANCTMKLEQKVQNAVTSTKRVAAPLKSKGAKMHITRDIDE